MFVEKKKVISLAAVPVAVLVALYLSGYLFLLMTKLPTSILGPTTFYQYFARYHEVPAVAWKLKLSLAIGAGVPFILLGFLLYKLLTNRDSLYGDARFASVADLSKKGFFEQQPTSVVVGKANGRFLYFSGQQFPLLAAPTRSGKGVGIVIPNLLSYQESMVVLDIKQENFELTSGFRQKYGQEVYLFNPFAEDRKTHRWNPLTYVSDDPDFRVSDLMSIAAMLYPVGEDGKDRFWMNQAQNMFLALALFLFERREQKRKDGVPAELLPVCSIGALYRLSSGDGTDLRAYFTKLSEMPFVSSRCKTAFAGMLSQAEETFSSILGTFKEPLLPWLNPITDAATAADDFLLTDVRKRKMTIYIGIQPNKLAEARLIINLFFSQLININTKELPQNNPELKYQCLLLMDEFTSIGRVDIIAKAVSYMAGYNIRLLPIIQSISQLDGTYGQEQSRTLMTNHALQILYTPREQKDANEYSEMLGYRSVRKESVSRGRDVSKTESDEKRALMLPQELKAMSQDKEIFLCEALSSPVMCEKIRYYQEPVFKERLIPKADIPLLTL
ncbi:type IV secretory system conjugative DNA transfer family protein [Leeia sp. TBRC 13508]|uniref:Type IV secretory system conjugative DNA transfer family protein n=1 Tax=Leeia speluncae TaxID=2884804 RepID=A0ABS8D3W1_9NEIS|nr:type IV secretory system conjugative DNA transfer family protein [Leeia speluncae]MCB6182889.1 type IV secretory system conjugative DNA transfer family protein [Leeia speluncae]